MTSLKIELNSGREIYDEKILLFPKNMIAEHLSLKMNGIKKLGGVSSGIGFWGSPEWGIGGSIALGVIESIISTGVQQEGLKMIADANKLMEKAISGGALIDISHIRNVDKPFPAKWIGYISGDKEVDLRTITSGCGYDEVVDWLNKNNISVDNTVKKVLFGYQTLVDTVTINMTDLFVYDGSEFIAVGSDTGVEYIKWSDVSTYKFTPK